MDRGDSPGGRAIIIYGPIGSGKTTTCLRLIEELKGRGLKVLGLISPRVYEGDRLIGYDLLSLSTGERRPLCRVPERAEGDWPRYGRLHYAFSPEAFRWGNRILEDAAGEIGEGVIVFIDEFGRLEALELGLYEGAMAVAEGLRRGGAAIYTCRDNLIERVEELLRGRARRVSRHRPHDIQGILRCLGLGSLRNTRLEAF